MGTTNTKPIVAVGVGLLAVAVIVAFFVVALRAQIARRETWRVPNITTEIVERTAPQVHILPTKFPRQMSFANGRNDSKHGAINAGIRRLVCWAYHWSAGRLIFTGNFPQQRFDMIATLREGNEAALQKELQRVTGLTARHLSTEVPVLILKRRDPGAPNLKPAVPGGENPSWGIGNFHCDDAPISALTDYLEDYFWFPVIDETGLAGNYQMELSWHGQGYDGNHEAIRQALLDELGLELVRDHRSVDMLVVQKGS